MRRNLILFFTAAVLFSLGSNQAQAQKDKYRNPANDPVAKLDYAKKLRWTDNLFRSGSYYNAIEYYKQLLQEQPRNSYLMYQLAECSWYMRDYAPAASYYSKTYALASDLYPEAIYKEALMLKMQGKYDAAIAAFNQFINDNPKTFKKLKKRAEREIEGCKMGQNSINNPIPATVKTLGPNVNSAYTESAPYPLGDTALLFATMHSNDVVDKNMEDRKDYVSRFMVSQKFPGYLVDGKVDTFQWALPFNDGKFNDPKFHVGNGSFSPGGDRFYFTRCLEDNKHEMTCHIFVSQFKDKAWTEPQELGNGINEEGSSSTQPFIAKVGKKEVLFFSSNRTIQSRGGYDIWYSVYNDRQNTYRRPQNAGKQINTVGNEQTPFYDSKQGKLYFSSDGWVGMGGYDVYSAAGGPSRYTNLSNLGYPINTSVDELYYVQDPVGKPDAYVVSNRIGSIALKNPTCCDDIWRIQYEPKVYAMGKVLNKKNQKPVTNVVVKMVDEAGNLKTYNSTDGQFQFLTSRGHTYEITGDKNSFVSTHADVSTENILRSDPDDTVWVTVYMDSLQIDQEFRLDNILYDFDAATLRPESAASLHKLVTLMKDNPSVDVQIYSYTDGRGTADYNQQLSQERAQSVVDYVASQGISADRLSAKGMGSSDPVAPNTIDGKDNPDGRQQNRRTTFKITTDVPTRHLIFDSTKPGTIGEQEKNLANPAEMQLDSDPNLHQDEGYGEPGSRVNEE